ncbi:MAG: heavy-metal-associated domain-containing protein [Methylococcus sp.]|jgi:copper chaperone CopZ
MNTISLTVGGMKCGGCEKTVQDATSSVSGVISVKAFHQENRVEVVFDESLVSLAAIQKVIADKGYPIL